MLGVFLVMPRTKPWCKRLWLNRFLELEEKLEMSEDDAKRVAEEHAEYEAAIRRDKGITISEAEEKVKELIL